MGIAGLHAIVKPIMRKQHISAYKGSRIAIDGHSWLHQTMPSIAYELFHKKESTRHVDLLMKKIESLQAYDIEPIMVFDGDPVEGKENTNKERAVIREKYFREAEFFVKRNDLARARELMKRCVSVTPAVLLPVITALKKHGVEYIISPYEADAQLCFLQKIGYVQYIISEDSDLIPYGCTNVLYKYSGSTVEEYDSQLLHTCKGEYFSENILDICILSGCDYVESIRGVGINTAYKKLAEHGNIRKFLSAMQAANKHIVPDYMERLTRAKLTFLHHIVYNPQSGRREHLHPTMYEYDFLGTLENISYRMKNTLGLDVEFARHSPGKNASSQSASQQTQSSSQEASSRVDLRDVPQFIAASEKSPYFN